MIFQQYVEEEALQSHWSHFRSQLRSQDLSLLYTQALTGVIQRSTAQTVMGLDAELQGAAAALQVGGSGVQHL